MHSDCTCFLQLILQASSEYQHLVTEQAPATDFAQSDQGWLNLLLAFEYLQLYNNKDF